MVKLRTFNLSPMQMKFTFQTTLFLMPTITKVTSDRNMLILMVNLKGLVGTKSTCMFVAR